MSKYGEQVQFSQEITDNDEKCGWLKQMRGKFSQDNGEKCAWLKQMQVADKNMIPTNSSLNVTKVS